MDERPPRSRDLPLGAADLRRGIVIAGAAALMFFFGAPLAHVVAFEEWRRDQRLQQTYRRQRRCTVPGRLNLVPLCSENAA